MEHSTPPTLTMHDDAVAPLGTAHRRRLVMWIVVSIFAALLAYFGFRGYLNPELLFQFGNALHC